MIPGGPALARCCSWSSQAPSLFLLLTALHAWQAHEAPIRTARFLHNGEYMLSSDDAGIVKYWKRHLDSVKVTLSFSYVSAAQLGMYRQFEMLCPAPKNADVPRSSRCTVLVHAHVNCCTMMLSFTAHQHSQQWCRWKRQTNDGCCGVTGASGAQ